MLIKMNALVIKEQTVGESDKLLTLLTAEEGIIKAFVRRAKNLKNSNSSATSLLSYSRLSIYKGRDKYIIDDATPIEIFFGLRTDISSLSLAQYFCELAVILVQDHSDSTEYLRLILNSISFLCKGEKDPLMIKAITELRLLSSCGFMPNVVACSDCACYENEEWHFIRGQIYCKDCVSKNYGFNQSVLTAIRYIVYSDFKKIYSFNLNGRDNILKLCKISEEYCLETIGRVPMTLDFFKTVSDDKY